MRKIILFVALCLTSLLGGAQVSTSGLVAYYPLNGNALDFSGNKNNGTVTGGVVDTTDRFGNKNKAKYFDGSTGFISVNHSSSISSPDSQITMAAWINMKSLTRWQPILIKNSNGSGREHTQYDLFVDNYGPDYWSNIAWCPAPQPGPTNCYGVGQIQYSTNTWYFLTITLAKDTATYYLNGNVIVKGFFRKTNLTATNTQPLEIGRNWNSSSPMFFTGSMDDLRIYNRGLSGAEVKSLYVEEFNDPKPTCLVAEYKFDGNVLDNSGNGNHGTISGGVKDTTDRFGNNNGAKFFNGTSGLVSVPNSATIASPDSQITLTAWVKMSDLRRWQPVFSKITQGVDRSNIEYDMFIDNYGSFGSLAWCPAPQPGPTNCYSYSPINYNTNDWYFLTITLAKDTNAFYLNGELLRKGYFRTADLITDNGYPLEIGRSWNSSDQKYYYGFMDDLKVYSCGLSASAVRALYDAEKPGDPTTGIFDEDKKEAALVIYPNPSSTGVFNLSKSIENGTYSITNAIGEKIGASINERNELDLSNYSKGLYIINVTTGTETYTSKLIIN